MMLQVPERFGHWRRPSGLRQRANHLGLLPETAGTAAIGFRFRYTPIAPRRSDDWNLWAYADRLRVQAAGFLAARNTCCFIGT